MKDVKHIAVHAAIDFLIRSQLNVLTGEALHDIVISAHKWQSTTAAKRYYVKDRVRGIEHGITEPTVRLITELAMYRYQHREQRR